LPPGLPQKSRRVRSARQKDAWHNGTSEYAEPLETANHLPQPKLVGMTAAAQTAGQQQRPPPLPPPPACRVYISGIPGKLLSDMMVEGMLQQAGLENAVLGIYLCRQNGDVLVDCCTPCHAAICTEHFNGCCWDRLGRTVTAWVVTSATASSSRKATAARLATKPTEALDPVKVVSSLRVPQWATLSAAAAPFTPSVIQATAVAVDTEVTAKLATVVEDVEKPASPSSAASTAECGSDCGEE